MNAAGPPVPLLNAAGPLSHKRAVRRIGGGTIASFANNEARVDTHLQPATFVRSMTPFLPSTVINSVDLVAGKVYDSSSFIITVVRMQDVVAKVVGCRSKSLLLIAKAYVCGR